MNLPTHLQRLDERKIRVLDVRPLLIGGREPFQKIMQAVDRLEADEVLRLEAPFEPTPLYGVLARKGLDHWGREVPDADGKEGYWEVYFYRWKPMEEGSADGDDRERPHPGRGEIREIDVRGLEAPEPLELVLANLESLVYGEVLLVHHHRNPLILFDILDERGYAQRSTQLEEDYWQIRIWRRA